MKKRLLPLFSFYHLPEECDTVFFPGCTLTGTRPEKTLKTFSFLRTRIPGTGMVLDCCTKPSHDLGRTGFFKAMFSEMCAYLRGHGITRIITACPSCHALFSARSPFTTLSVYEILAQEETLPLGPGALSQPPGGEKGSGLGVVLQDPCQARKDRASQRAARLLVKRAGLDLVPLKASGPATLCCGEGASVGCVSPGLAGVWGQKKAKGGQGISRRYLLRRVLSKNKGLGPPPGPGL